MQRGQEEPNRRMLNKECPMSKLKTNIQRSTANVDEHSTVRPDEPARRGLVEHLFISPVHAASKAITH